MGADLENPVPLFIAYIWVLRHCGRNLGSEAALPFNVGYVLSRGELYMKKRIEEFEADSDLKVLQ